MASSTNAEAYEQEHVHTVYEQIAQHFSSTRYKPWPIISSFLSSLPNGSIGVDIGCGNGKNMPTTTNNANTTTNTTTVATTTTTATQAATLVAPNAPSIFIIGSDRSAALASIASTNKPPHDAVVADILHLPHPPRSFDFAMCIAVIHHLSQRQRRIDAVRSVLELLKEGRCGTALFYVWALEQKHSRRGWDEGGEQDVMVPWVLKLGKTKDKESEEKVFQRYYHLYKKGELEEDIHEAGGEILDGGYEKDNWWAIARRKVS